MSQKVLDNQITSFQLLRTGRKARRKEEKEEGKKGKKRRGGRDTQRKKKVGGEGEEQEIRGKNEKKIIGTTLCFQILKYYLFYHIMLYKVNS